MRANFLQIYLRDTRLIDESTAVCSSFSTITDLPINPSQAAIRVARLNNETQVQPFPVKDALQKLLPPDMPIVLHRPAFYFPAKERGDTWTPAILDEQ
ncbi:MAG TPA: hypothetical protein VJ836_05030 [Candidatus Saccharimonadales bacterium]|nr:hypothetical protein [Candidatus Saccharimonadales bacterium]